MTVLVINGILQRLFFFLLILLLLLLPSPLLLQVKPHMQRVPRSQRGGEVIEPLISTQWFVKMEGMAKKVREESAAADDDDGVRSMVMVMMVMRTMMIMMVMMVVMVMMTMMVMVMMLIVVMAMAMVINPMNESTVR